MGTGEASSLGGWGGVGGLSQAIRAPEERAERAWRGGLDNPPMPDPIPSRLEDSEVRIRKEWARSQVLLGCVLG